MRYDWVVVGAGLSGATLAERIATQLGQTVLVVERRPHVAGNAYDEIDQTGIRVHRYGAHIFHTVSHRVWSYLSRFTEWLPYTHRVLAQVEGTQVPLPFNLTTLHALAPPGEAAGLEARLVEEVGGGGRIPVLGLLDHEDPALRRLGQLVYDSVFLRYTTKQWGLRPEEIDRAVTGRVPVVVGRDDRYFRDRYQGIPAEGYTALVGRMLDQPGIVVETGVDFADIAGAVRYDRLVYTGPIDEFFGHAHGALPYRSLRFEHRTLPVDRHQAVAVVNYPDDRPYTRVIEHAHFADQHVGATTITHEYPEAHLAGYNEPYYPMPTLDGRRRYARYAREAAGLAGRVVFSGRLADYRYYDMDQAVAHALTVFRNQIAGHDRRDGVLASEAAS
ncbi:MAG TPA: UDP-galactopyranose mutase [Acidimicrobiales bacterium]|nr:UDP-galactopyranose mutase [Acidimicrobiales bacterium]